MQNIDYSRKYRIPPQPAHREEAPEYNGNFHSGIIVLIGSVFIFTAGVYVGLKLEQKEDKFSRNEKITVRNYSNVATRPEENSQKDEPKEASETNNKPAELHIPAGIKYPPRKNTLNYVIQIGSYQAKEAGEVGKKIIQKYPDLQGRIFKTSQGRLYIGYFYEKTEAMEILEKMKKTENNKSFLKSFRY